MSNNFHRLFLERDFPVWPENSKVVKDPETTEDLRGGEGLSSALLCSEGKVCGLGPRRRELQYKAWRRAHFPSEVVARLPEPLTSPPPSRLSVQRCTPNGPMPTSHLPWLVIFSGHFLNPQGIKNPCSLLEWIPGGQGQPVSRHSAAAEAPRWCQSPWAPSSQSCPWREFCSLCASVASLAKITALPHDVGTCQPSAACSILGKGPATEWALSVWLLSSQSPPKHLPVCLLSAIF